MDKEYLTKEKLEELKCELDELVHTKRKEVADDLEYAKALGDLSENAEYHEARNTQAVMEDRIKKIEEILKSAVVISSTHGGAIRVGSKVILERNKAKFEYTIVGSEEANTAEGKISVKSPLGEAIMGKSKGEDFSFETPKGKVTYKILEVK